MMLMRKSHDVLIIKVYDWLKTKSERFMLIDIEAQALKFKFFMTHVGKFSFIIQGQKYISENSSAKHELQIK